MRYQTFADLYHKITTALTFEEKNFTQEQLVILFKAQGALNEEGVNPNFIASAQEYFKKNWETYKKHATTKVFQFEQPSFGEAFSQFILDDNATDTMLDRYETKLAEYKLKKTEALLENGDHAQDTEDEEDELPDDNEQSQVKNIITIVDDIKANPTKREIFKNIQEKMDQLSLFLPFDEDKEALFVIPILLSISTKNVISANQVLAQLEFETIHNILDSFINNKWDISVSMLNLISIPQNTQKLLQELVEKGGLEAIRKIFGAIDLGLSAENLKNIDSPDLINEALDSFHNNFTYPSTTGADPRFKMELYKSLAKHYSMPVHIYQRVLEEIVPQINFDTKELEKVIPASLDLGKVHSKGSSYAILLEPNDPSGFFIGKMTDSCMHVEGAAEDTAVIPAYKSNYAGFIAIQVTQAADQGSRISKSKVKAGCYVWQTIEGDIVIDSFEYKGEGIKNFIPFITKLSEHLDARGLKLFVGTGGKTPEIFEGDTLISTSERPEAIDNDTAKCDDSEHVCHIKPGVVYNIDIAQELKDEEEEQTVTFSTPEEFEIYKLLTSLANQNIGVRHSYQERDLVLFFQKYSLTDKKDLIKAVYKFFFYKDTDGTLPPEPQNPNHNSFHFQNPHFQNKIDLIKFVKSIREGKIELKDDMKMHILLLQLGFHNENPYAELEKTHAFAQANSEKFDKILRIITETTPKEARTIYHHTDETKFLQAVMDNALHMDEFIINLLWEGDAPKVIDLAKTSPGEFEKYCNMLVIEKENFVGYKIKYDISDVNTVKILIKYEVTSDSPVLKILVDNYKQSNVIKLLSFAIKSPEDFEKYCQLCESNKELLTNLDSFGDHYLVKFSLEHKIDTDSPLFKLLTNHSRREKVIKLLSFTTKSPEDFEKYYQLCESNKELMQNPYSLGGSSLVKFLLENKIDKDSPLFELIVDNHMQNKIIELLSFAQSYPEDFDKYHVIILAEKGQFFPKITNNNSDTEATKILFKHGVTSHSPAFKILVDHWKQEKIIKLLSCLTTSPGDFDKYCQLWELNQKLMTSLDFITHSVVKFLLEKKIDAGSYLFKLIVDDYMQEKIIKLLSIAQNSPKEFEKYYQLWELNKEFIDNPYSFRDPKIVKILLDNKIDTNSPLFELIADNYRQKQIIKLLSIAQNSPADFEKYCQLWELNKEFIDNSYSFRDPEIVKILLDNKIEADSELLSCVLFQHTAVDIIRNILTYVNQSADNLKQYLETIDDLPQEKVISRSLSFDDYAHCFKKHNVKAGSELIKLIYSINNGYPHDLYIDQINTQLSALYSAEDPLTDTPLSGATPADQLAE